MELLVVITVIGILAGLAMSRDPGNNISLLAQTQQLANDIRYTQSLAMSRALRYRVNLSAGSYSITDINSNVVPNVITGANSTTLGSGMTITLPPTNLPNDLIAFDSQGTPYTNSTATTTLSSAATITVKEGTLSHTITIAPQTGKLTVQ